MRRLRSGGLDDGAQNASVRRFRVEIDLAKVSEHMSREEGRPVSTDEIRQLLKDARFKPIDVKHWSVAEPDIGILDPSEVISIEPIEPGETP